MADFLLELRSEEIPARMQAGARAELEKQFRAAMKDAGVAHGALTVWSTPRRLALIARDLPEATEAVREETKGPRTSAPAQALEGFLRKSGLTQDQLTTRDGVWFAVTEKPGRATIDVLAEAIPSIVRQFAWPKSMRWGAASCRSESPRWVRPLSGIVAILGEALVPCEVAGVTSQYATVGHRFHHPDIITIGSATDYAAKMRAAHVIVDHEERAALVRDGARAAATAAGLTLVEDEGLVIENAGLTEWPVPLLGRFDEAFLEVPPEVIQLTARTNQKYFICKTPLPLAGGAGGGQPDSIAPDQPTPDPSRKREGDLANAFVCTANIAAKDGGAAIVDGNRKVLAARLSDARFFWQQDRKVPLAEQAKKLERITFHEKLGTVADKVERVAKLARWLVEEGIVSPLPPAGGTSSQDSPLPPAGGAGGGQRQSAASEQPTPDPSRKREGDARAELANQAERAARLCKADLVTEMVGEFPELQGLMGGYYARAEGLPDAVADAIRDHYKPVGQGDDVPTAPVTVAVSLADKLDTLMCFFAIGEKPTGSKDPFALRRAALGVIRLVLENGLRFYLDDTLETMTDVIASGWPEAERHGERYQRARVVYAAMLDHIASGNAGLHWFFAERLKVQQREAGVRHDLIDAVFKQDDDLVRLLARVHALQAFIATEDGANLLAGYKRAANILRKEGHAPESGAPAKAGASGGSAQPPEMPAFAGMPLGEGAQISLSYTPEPAEKALVDSLAAAGPRAANAVAAEDFAGAMAALASLRGPIDAFFDSVTVNDANPAKRESRLSLLDSFRAAVHNVADFSKIEG